MKDRERVKGKRFSCVHKEWQECNSSSSLGGISDTNQEKGRADGVTLQCGALG